MSLISLAPKTEDKSPHFKDFTPSQAAQKPTHNSLCSLPHPIKIPALNSPEKSFLFNRSVTIHTLPMAEKLSPIQNTETQDNLSIHSLEAPKKKKKKKPDSASIDKARKQLGSPFALPPLNLSEALPTTSLFAEKYCPKFNEQEKELLKSLLIPSTFSDNLNLFDVFLADLQEMIDSIKIELEKLTSIDEIFMKEAVNWFKNNDIVETLYCVYLYTYGKGDPSFDIDRDSTCQNMTVPKALILFKKFHQNLFTMNIDIGSLKQEKIHIKSKQLKLKSIIDLYASKFKPVLDLSDLLTKKIGLIIKFFEHPSNQDNKNFETLFLLKRTCEWTESYQSHAPLSRADKLAAVTKFHNFVRTFLVQGSDSGLILYLGDRFIEYIDSVKAMFNPNYSKKKIADFITMYKEYSYCTADALFLGYRNLDRAMNDPSYTYAKYCEENKIEQPSKSLDQKNLIAHLTNVSLSFDITDKWVNDINQTITCNFLSELEGTYFKAPQSHVQRLVKMLDLIIAIQIAPPDFKLNEEPESQKVKNPIVLAVKVNIQDAIKTLKLEFKDFFKFVNFQKVHADLTAVFSDAVFRLSRCILSLLPIHGLSNKPNFSKMDNLLKKILQTVHAAKEKGEIRDLDPKELKIEIQKLLISECVEIYTSMMIIADTYKLITDSHPSDILHLIPNELVKLLNLQGFDEIFMEKSLEGNKKPQELETQECSQNQKPPSEDDLQKPIAAKISLVDSIATTVIAKKPSEKPNLSTSTVSKKQQPTPDDIMEADKFRLVKTLLEHMDFILKRIRGDHHIFVHKVTGGSVSVPKDVGDKGTRSGIKKQTEKALEIKEK